MFSYDPSILGSLQVVPQSVPEVVRILETIDATCIEADGLKWFNWLYLQVTQAVAAQLAAGRFADSAWMAALDVEFASLYFSAARLSLSGRQPPDCWQVLFAARACAPIARIQFALAGINAHINHDLAEAIVSTCRITNTAPDHDGPHYRDYTALNATLDSLVESAKAALNVRLPGDALPPVSHLEETIAAWNVCAARESAWRNAECVWQLRSMPSLAASFLDVLDGTAAVIGKTLLVPVP